MLIIGNRLVALLNESGQRHLVRLLETLKLRNAAPTKFARVVRSGRTWLEVVPTAERARLEKEVNRQLARYAHRPQLAHLSDDESVFVDVPLGPGANDSAFRREVQSFGLLRQIADSGELGRVRRCPICGKWFMARRPDAVYCGTRCARKKARQVLKDTGKDAAYKRFRRKRNRIQDRIGQLAEKRNDGVRLTKEENAELTAAKVALAKLHQEYEKRRKG